MCNVYLHYRIMQKIRYRIKTIVLGVNMEPTDEQLRQCLKDMVDVLEPTQLHAIWLICAKLYLKWSERMKPICFSKWGTKGTDEEMCGLCSFESECYHAKHDDIMLGAVFENDTDISA